MIFNNNKKEWIQSWLLYQEQKQDSLKQSVDPVKTELFSWKRESRAEKEVVVAEMMIFGWQQKQMKQTHFLKMKMP